VWDRALVLAVVGGDPFLQGQRTTGCDVVTCRCGVLRAFLRSQCAKPNLRGKPSSKHVHFFGNPLSKPVHQVVSRTLIFPEKEVRHMHIVSVVLNRPINTNVRVLRLQQFLCCSPRKSGFVAPAKQRVHVLLEPCRSTCVRRIARTPGHVDLGTRFGLGLELQLAGVVRLVTHVECSIARDLCAYTCCADTRVEAVGFFRDRNAYCRPYPLQFLLIDLRAANGINVDLPDVDASRHDLVDQVDCRVHGLCIEVVDRGRQHMRRYVLCGERARGPAAGFVEVAAGRAEGAHEGGADFGGEHLGVVEVVCFGEERVVQLHGEVEEPVDHGTCIYQLWCLQIGSKGVPRTGPLPASSTPNTTSLDISSAICCGIAEKCEYDLPASRSCL
jgi:hypothetical protein